MNDNSRQNIKRIINVPAIIVLGILIQVSMAYLVDALTGLMHGTQTLDAYFDVMEKLTTYSTMQVFYVIIFSPVLEESIFRLLIYRGLRKVAPAYIANILQAILFGIYHMNLIQGAYAVLLGCFLGEVNYLFEAGMSNPTEDNGRAAKGTITVPWVMGFMYGLLLHMSINAAGLYIAPWFPSFSITCKICVGIVGCLLVIIADIFMRRRIIK